MDIIIDPGNDRLIGELYAWVSIDPKTNLEGIIAFSAGGQMLQAVTSSDRTAMLMRDKMKEVGRASGKNIKLLRFSKPDVLLEIEC